MIFASVAVYTLGRELGAEGGNEEFRRQCAEPNEEHLPASRTIARLRHVEEVALCVDANGSSVGKSRARMLHAFYSMPDADVWVSCDDDVETSFETLRWLIEAVRDTKGVCIAPCLVRGRTRRPLVNIMFESAPVLRPLSHGGYAVRCMAGGFGLVAMHRDAAAKIYAQREDLAWLDEDGIEKRAAFLESLDPIDKLWYGEDLSFFLATLPKDVRVECLVTGHTVHDGMLLDLSKVPTEPARLSVPSTGTIATRSEVPTKPGVRLDGDANG